MARAFLTVQELVAKYPEHIQYLVLEAKMPTAAKAAEQLGLKEDDIAKTCILKTDKGDFVAAILQGTDRINQKQMTTLLGCKKVRFATAEEVLQVSGYVAGGTPPVGLAEGIQRIFLDKRVFQHESVIAGGGEQESLLRITPGLIQELSGAEVVEISML